MNVEEILTTRNIQFQVSGSDYVVKCLNPEHDDNNPSMRIDKVSGVYNCFSCGYKGDIFKLFNEAKNELSILREELNNLVDSIFQEAVGLSIPSTSQPFDKEYRGITAETMIKFKAFTDSLTPEFADRLWFPITQLSGKISCFLGRDLLGASKAKYKIFPRKSLVPLFPLSSVSSKIVLVEGIFDMLRLQDNGIPNVLCALGTNTITDAKIKQLKLLGVSFVDVIFDGDKAGYEGAKELVAKLNANGIKAEDIRLPEGLDPGGMSAEQITRLKGMLG